MEPKLELDVRNDVGNFSIVTSSGTIYRACRKAAGDIWFIQRFPSPSAGSLWIDLGGPVNRVFIRVGDSATFDVTGGYLDASYWAISSTVVSITEESGELRSAETEYLLENTGVDLTPRPAAEDAAKCAALVERHQKMAAEARPVTIHELADLLSVDKRIFRGRSAEDLSTIMSTPQTSLRIDGIAVTPWAYLAAGNSPWGEVLEVLLNDVEF